MNDSVDAPTFYPVSGLDRVGPHPQRHPVGHAAFESAGIVGVADEAEVRRVALGRVVVQRVVNLAAGPPGSFEAEADDPFAWSVVLNPQVESASRRFPTRSFPPPGLYPQEQALNVIILPLGLIIYLVVGYASVTTMSVAFFATLIFLVKAIQGVSPEDLHLRLIGVKQIRAFDQEITVVSLLRETNPAQRLVGAVLTTEDPLRVTPRVQGAVVRPRQPDGVAEAGKKHQEADHDERIGERSACEDERAGPGYERAGRCRVLDRWFGSGQIVERERCQEHDEACWQRNRRIHIVAIAQTKN